MNSFINFKQTYCIKKFQNIIVFSLKYGVWFVPIFDTTNKNILTSAKQEGIIAR